MQPIDDLYPRGRAAYLFVHRNLFQQDRTIPGPFLLSIASSAIFRRPHWQGGILTSRDTEMHGMGDDNCFMCEIMQR